MKKIGFIIILQLAHILHASASAGQPVYITEESITWDYENSACKFAGLLNRGCYDLADIDGFAENKEAVSNFESKINNTRASILAATTTLPDATQKRALEFFNGVVKRIGHAYANLLQSASQLAPKQAELIIKSYTQESTWISFSDPFSSTAVKKGEEQAACDLVKVLLNLQADYLKEKALLVGVRAIDINQLLMFLTGAKQVVLNGQGTPANQFVQNLYAAYAKLASDLPIIYALEAAAAPYLLRDNERVTLTYFNALTYNTCDYPNCQTRDEIHDKPAMLNMLSARQNNPLMLVQNANIKLFMDQLEFSKKLIEQLHSLSLSEQDSRKHLLEEEDNTSATMYASFASKIARVNVDLADADAVCVQARNRLLTQENNAQWGVIDKKLTDITQCIKNTGKTPAGWGANELIMDYGSEERSSITREMRTNTESVLNAQFAILGVTGLDMCEQKSVRDIAATLFQWFEKEELNFNPAEKQIVKEVLSAMAVSAPADIANNTHLQFLAAIYKLYRLSEFYQNWPKINERKSFLDELKTTIFQAFGQVVEHKGNPLKCATGARGRAFVLNLSMINAMRSHHQ